MFRYVTELKALVIDADSFSFSADLWEKLARSYQLFFLTESDATERMACGKYGNNHVYKSSERVFWPNQETHHVVLKKMRVHTTEIAYVSADFTFLVKALGFLSGTILVRADGMSYPEISMAPDMIYSSLESLEVSLLSTGKGFSGEVMINPLGKRGERGAVMVPLKDGQYRIPVMVLGRYYGKHHYMYQLHPYSSAIFLNKQYGKKYYGIFNSMFAQLLSNSVAALKKRFEIDCVCSVPPHPGKENRFLKIINIISEQNGVENINDRFFCIKEYDKQKISSEVDRQKNVKGAFSYTGSLQGKNIVLIDDIISTGATVKECYRTLKACGAKEIFVIVMAVNQLGGSYWCLDNPAVWCRHCGDKMYLTVNSRSKKFFYSCKCGKTLDYEMAYNQLIEKINMEFTY